MERLVSLLVVIGIIVMVAVDFLVLEPTLGHTYFLYTTVVICALMLAWFVWWLWRATGRRGRAKDR